MRFILIFILGLVLFQDQPALAVPRLSGPNVTSRVCRFLLIWGKPGELRQLEAVQDPKNPDFTFPVRFTRIDGSSIEGRVEIKWSGITLHRGREIAIQTLSGTIETLDLSDLAKMDLLETVLPGGHRVRPGDVLRNGNVPIRITRIALPAVPEVSEVAELWFEQPTDNSLSLIRVKADQLLDIQRSQQASSYFREIENFRETRAFQEVKKMPSGFAGVEESPDSEDNDIRFAMWLGLVPATQELFPNSRENINRWTTSLEAGGGSIELVQKSLAADSSQMQRSKWFYISLSNELRHADKAYRITTKLSASDLRRHWKPIVKLARAAGASEVRLPGSSSAFQSDSGLSVQFHENTQLKTFTETLSKYFSDHGINAETPPYTAELLPGIGLAIEKINPPARATQNIARSTLLSLAALGQGNDPWAVARAFQKAGINPDNYQPIKFSAFQFPKPPIGR